MDISLACLCSVILKTIGETESFASPISSSRLTNLRNSKSLFHVTLRAKLLLRSNVYKKKKKKMLHYIEMHVQSDMFLPDMNLAI